MDGVLIFYKTPQVTCFRDETRTSTYLL